MELTTCNCCNVRDESIKPNCPQCLNMTCNECWHTCCECGALSCDNCNKSCEECGGHYCNDCVTEHVPPYEDVYYCNDCIGRCDECDIIINNIHYSELYSCYLCNITNCDECPLNHCKSCDNDVCKNCYYDQDKLCMSCISIKDKTILKYQKYQKEFIKSIIYIMEYRLSKQIHLYIKPFMKQIKKK